MKKNYNEWTLEGLKERERAVDYLNASLDAGQKDFLFALHNVAIMQGGFPELAAKTKIIKESLYKILSPNGNPHLDVFIEILNALGFKLEFTLLSNRETSLNRSLNKWIRLNSLHYAHTDLSVLWNNSKNDTLTSNDVTPTSHKKVWWLCSVKDDHEWKSPISTIVKKKKQLSELINLKNFDLGSLLCPHCSQDKKLEIKREII